MDQRLLSIIVKVPPEAWDAIVPMGPLRERFATERVGAQLDKFALNPRTVSSAVMGARLVHAMFASNPPTKAGMSAFVEDLDNWCGTGYPRWWVKPPRGPRFDVTEFFLGAGLATLALAAGFEHNPELQTELGERGERLLAQALDTAAA